jgi:hypothetical protein
MRRKLGLRVLSNNSRLLFLGLRESLGNLRMFPVLRRQILHHLLPGRAGALPGFLKISSKAEIDSRTRLATRASNEEKTLLLRHLKEVVTSKDSP